MKDGEWLPGTPETLRGSYVFVCSHGSRDRRCGVCGPPLISRFREEIDLHGLQGKVSVRPCSHIGGHKYAGNVIIFGSSINKEVTGHWYGSLCPKSFNFFFFLRFSFPVASYCNPVLLFTVMIYELSDHSISHRYGYVAPEDVPQLLEQHIGRGEIVDWLWR